MILRPPRSTLFPTRRSSDLWWAKKARCSPSTSSPKCWRCSTSALKPRKKTTSKQSLVKSTIRNYPRDRKSTRLNSSHVEISYAVFCLKKKKKKKKKEKKQEN